MYLVTNSRLHLRHAATFLCQEWCVIFIFCSDLLLKPNERKCHCMEFAFNSTSLNHDVRLTVTLCLWWENKLNLATTEHRKSKNVQFLIKTRNHLLSGDLFPVFWGLHRGLHHLLQYQVPWMAYFLSCPPCCLPFTLFL